MNFSSGRFRLILVGLVVVVLGVACSSASAAWTVRSTSIPAGTTESRLYAVSCTTEKSCWSVGEYRNSSGVLEPIAWNPISASYALPPTPGKSPQLLDVSCPPATSHNFCMAVGRFTNTGGSLQAFAEKYTDLTGWQLQTLTFPAGNTAAELGSISCASENECMAVGDYHNASGEHYLAERWTSAAGGTWTPETPAEPTGGGYLVLTAISCPALGECIGVGEYRVSPYNPANQTMETEIYSSSTWTRQGGISSAPFAPSSGTVPFIATDSCVSMTACAAVGYYNTTAGPLERMIWKKIAASPGWERVSQFALAGETSLHGVSCWAATSCVAVGQNKVSGVGAAFAEAESSGSWSGITLPTVTGSSETYLNRDACLSSTFCFAVGWSVSSGVTSMLVERNF
jgi:hypothetical protein